jgi:hypothetical protein
MFGVLLIAIGTTLEEIASSFGKWSVTHNEEGIYTMGFLNVFWCAVLFLIILLIKGEFSFDIRALPLFTIFIILEIAQSYSSVHATVEAERSTVGFLMVGTIPLLMIVDKVLGYPIELWNMIGVSLIVISLLFLFINHGLGKKGLKYVIFSAVNAVATISIYKYLITHYMSVEMQQFITSTIILIFLFAMAYKETGENPLKFVFKKKFLAQSVPRGIAGVIGSFAYLFAPASIITGARRGIGVLASVFSGSKYFHEKHILVKIASFVLIIVGLVLLTI